MFRVCCADSGQHACPRHQQQASRRASRLVVSIESTVAVSQAFVNKPLFTDFWLAFVGCGSDRCMSGVRSNNFTKCRKEQKTFEEALAAAKEAK